MAEDLNTRSSYKWWVFGAIAVGSFLSVIDYGSVLVALPAIETYFDSDLPTVQWVVIGHALVISILLLPMGRLGDMVGRKRVYVAGFVIFVATSAVAGFSVDLTMLIGAKVLQGVGSAMIQGTAMASLISAFPDSERGKAMGTHLSVVGTGVVAGTAIGGFLVSAWGWQAVFLVNVPIGIVTIGVSWFLLPEDSGALRNRPSASLAAASPTSASPTSASPTSASPPSSLPPPSLPPSGLPASGRFDWIGAILSGTALLILLLILGQGDRIGWTSFLAMAGVVATVLFLAVFIWWELRVASPLLELRLFQRKLVAMGAAAGWVTFLASSSSRFLLTFYLQQVLGHSPREIGLYMMPAALAMAVLGPVAGRLSDRFGWQKLTAGGLAIGALAWFMLAEGLDADGSSLGMTPLVLVVVALTIQSAGTGVFYTPNNSSILGAVERSRYGVVSALTQLVRNTANLTSVAMVTAIVTITMGSMGVEPSLSAVSPESIRCLPSRCAARLLRHGRPPRVRDGDLHRQREKEPKSSPQPKPQQPPQRPLRLNLLTEALTPIRSS